MRVLIIKMSSLGDLIHTLPALTDAGLAIPNIQFDWVTERAFSEIPYWHPQVDQVIPIHWRNWRHHLGKKATYHELHEFYKKLKNKSYDLIIDAQGLIKSALVTYLAHGPKHGLNWQSAWESIASLFYQHHHQINPHQHAITRNRLLFAQSLGYSLSSIPEFSYGIDSAKFPKIADSPNPYLIFLHGTTWPTKQWPEQHWSTLLEKATTAGYRVFLFCGNLVEKNRAERIAQHSKTAQVLPNQTLSQIASLLMHASGVVAVDSGLGHLAAALSVPTVSLYGPTDPILIGAQGPYSTHLKIDFTNCGQCTMQQCRYVREETSSISPNTKKIDSDFLSDKKTVDCAYNEDIKYAHSACLSKINPDHVWDELKNLIQKKS